jgi:hypothetical protein
VRPDSSAPKTYTKAVQADTQLSNIFLSSSFAGSQACLSALPMPAAPAMACLHN